VGETMRTWFTRFVILDGSHPFQLVRSIHHWGGVPKETCVWNKVSVPLYGHPLS